eukprot:scaffold2961_cov263-Prasinococcus_capsulatus_cf.AAC.4
MASARRVVALHNASPAAGGSRRRTGSAHLLGGLPRPRRRLRNLGRHLRRRLDCRGGFLRLGRGRPGGTLRLQGSHPRTQTSRASVRDDDDGEDIAGGGGEAPRPVPSPWFRVACSRCFQMGARSFPHACRDKGPRSRGLRQLVHAAAADVLSGEPLRSRLCAAPEQRAHLHIHRAPPPSPGTRAGGASGA